MAKDINIIVKRDGVEVECDFVFGQPFGGKKVKKVKKVTKSVDNDFCALIPIVVRGEGFQMGTTLEIDAENKTEYVLEV